MARRKAGGRPARQATARKPKRASRSAKRPKVKRGPTRRPAPRKAARKALKRSAAKRRAPKRATARTLVARKPAAKTIVLKRAKKAKPSVRKRRVQVTPTHTAPPRLARERRTLDELIPTPPSSLNMDRHGSAARTGRAEMAEAQANHASMTPDINAGDVDVNIEDAYFVGDEAPGGDNPTPDQDVVDEIGKALGVEYQDAEELRASDKVAERDKHRWELDPASSEDYRDRKK
jgi:uncharacterized protein DUF6335